MLTVSPPNKYPLLCCFTYAYVTVVPEPLVLHTDDCQVVLRLQFAAEHSNVLIVMVEQLSGCSSTTSIHHIRLDLQSVCAAQAEPVMVRSYLLNSGFTEFMCSQYQAVSTRTRKWHTVLQKSKAKTT